MQIVKNIEKREKSYFAAYLLYAASIFGIFQLFSTSDTQNPHSVLGGIDIGVYVLLFVMAILIHRGFNFAKIFYVAIASIWYIAIIGVLPWLMDFTQDLLILSLQLALTILAFCILYIRSETEPTTTT